MKKNPSTNLSSLLGDMKKTSSFAFACAENGDLDGIVHQMCSMIERYGMTRAEYLADTDDGQYRYTLSIERKSGKHD